jgi:hypothetical protein
MEVIAPPPTVASWFNPSTLVAVEPAPCSAHA